jgi:hypothetical protein
VSIRRRDLVRMGGALGGIALMPGRPVSVPYSANASGRVVLFGEGASSPYFALSEMPEGVERFEIDLGRAEPLGRLVLAAAEKGWEVHVKYIRFPDGFGRAYDVSVKDFRDRSGRRGRHLARNRVRRGVGTIAGGPGNLHRFGTPIALRSH